MIPLNVIPGGAVDRIARRYIQGLITHQWALWLVSQEIGSTDAWTPIVVLAEASQRIMAESDEKA